MKTRILKENIFRKEIRVFASLLVVFSVVPLLAHSYFRYFPEGIPYKGAYDIYSYYVIKCGYIYSPMLLSLGVVLHAYRTSALPLLFLVVFNSIEYFTQNSLTYSVSWNIVFTSVILLCLIYLSNIIKRSNILYDKRSIEYKKELEKFERMKELQIEQQKVVKELISRNAV